ncbi:FxLYD domain-containing protein [Streptomyces sp. NPDC026673]|uniref:FxLYD domain-containing protein n=1 Tax=Streptomyces sp. NPDC026673 TaxID=3155724 RepID=UPI0033DEAFC8
MSQPSHASPPGQYPPPHEPDWGRPPKKSGAGKILGFGVVAIVVVIGGSVAFAMTTGDDKDSSGGDSSAVSASPAGDSDGKPAPDDADVTSCGLGDFTKWPSAEVKVTNHSSEESDYQVRIDFVDASGNRIAQAVATTTGLAAGDSTQASAQGSEPVADDIKCKITEVLRKAS